MPNFSFLDELEVTGGGLRLKVRLPQFNWIRLELELSLAKLALYVLRLNFDGPPMSEVFDFQIAKFRNLLIFKLWI